MTLREYIKGLQQLAEKNPQTLDMLVITSSDDEGNYSPVYFAPSVGFFEDGEWSTYDDDYELEDGDINAVCVN